MKIFFLKKAFLLILISVNFSCDKPQERKDCLLTEIPVTEEVLSQTWVLIKKDINNTVETLPGDDQYPITLTFYPTKNFRGRHDANSYEGTYEIKEDTVLFSEIFITDIADISWYLDYISELCKMGKVHTTSFIQNKDVNNMQLQISNINDSVKLYFINKKWFQESYFELEDWYNY